MDHCQDKQAYSKTVFGFWIYLLTDFVLFATIFSAYIVLRKSLFGGPSAKDLLPLSYTFIQQILLLGCSLLASLGADAAANKDKKSTYKYFFSTFVLGSIFTFMLFNGFASLVEQGFGWQKSAFLSAYFTLTATFGLHVILALVWTLLFMHLLHLRNFSMKMLQRIECLKMFWQFLGVIWVTIFTVVYLLGLN